MHRQGKFPPEEGEGMDKRFSEETIRFFWELQFNNDRDWFQAHKQQYTDHVLTPLRQLAEEYSKSAERLAEGLERIREQLAWARGEEARDLERREEVMRLELMDLRSLSRYLREYYA